MNRTSVREIMLNAYPKKIIVEEEINEVAAGNASNNLVYTQQRYAQKKIPLDNSNGKKKWILALIISSVSVFLFSSFFLTFIDDICMKKEISLFDINGKPKTTLIITIFLILLIFTRICFSIL
jgi:hypothetical protein